MKRHISRAFLLPFLILFVLMQSFNAAASESGGAFLNVDIIDVGQGLSVLITTEDGALLYDGGPGSASSKVVSFIKQRGIASIDYVIASHYDEDHLNGVVGAIRAFDVKNVIGPDYSTDTSVYTSFMRAVEEEGPDFTYAVAGTAYQMGSALIQILMPLMPSYEDENDYSVAIKVTKDGRSVLLTGDCTTLGEGDMILAQEDLKSDILVLGHHGSSTSTSQAFLDAADPSIAVVSCGTGNPYGHPDRSVMDRLSVWGLSLYRTDLQGDIRLRSENGAPFTADLDPCTDYSGGIQETIPDPVETVPEVFDMPAAESTARYYVLNTNTGKFHYPDCSSVSDIYPQNREDVTMDRNEIIGMGYVPCKRCNP